jgi:hypothetical protein
MTHHFVVLKRPHLNPILDGTKIVELRFSRTPCAPFQRVHYGYELWLKLTGGPGAVTAKAEWVRGMNR